MILQFNYIIRFDIFQYFSLKKQGEASLPRPCPKKPIGIFLFSLKSEFQKSEENGEKRRKPEKISGFSVGIFFVNSSQRMKQPDRDAEANPVSRLWRVGARLPLTSEQADENRKQKSKAILNKYIVLQCYAFVC
ncbi:MAG: hypothetical protein J6K14_07980 [Clostridia bacterium]|nr:hypothetical protein [Clostridia bacterium]